MKVPRLYPFAVITIFIWIGFICSISFMEAWLKFRAPLVTLPIGLSIGRLIFAALNKVEWVLAVLTFIFIQKQKLKSIFFYIPLAILILQTQFLLPSLYARAEMILQGLTLLPSYIHFYYIFLEVLKLISLFILGMSVLYDRKSTFQLTERDCLK